MKRLMISLTTSLILLSGTPVMAADQASAQSALQAAEAAAKKTDSIHYLWTTTDKLLKDAQKSMQAGDYDKAEKMAKEAQIQAEIAYKQGIGQEAKGHSKS